MSDVITKVGEYQNCDDKTSKVLRINDGIAIGFDSDGDPDCWDVDTGEAYFGYDLYANPPIVQPPTPPEGFELKPKDYVAKEGDRCAWGRATAWHDVSGWKGCCAQELEDQFSARIPVYIASPIPKPAKPDPGEGWRLLEEGEFVEDGDEFINPKRPDAQWAASDNWSIRSKAQEPGFIYRRRIPKPFTISEHGCGVYETRDGREETVFSEERGCGAFHRWRGRFVYGDNGGLFSDGSKSNDDLVRYLRPLPKQETWTCTNEWRDRLFDTPRGTTRPDGLQQRIVNDEWRFVVREQRWTNGTDSEWRPVPVTTE